jgi:uncharacterized protein (DUF427 family)
MTQLQEQGYYQPQGYYLDTHPIYVELSPKRVRAFFNAVAVADSRRVMLLREHGHIPVYYFPRADVRMDLMTPTDRHTHCPYKGDASYWTIRVGDRVAENAVWGYPTPLSADAPDLSDYVTFYWDRMDHWFEEDEEVFVHARDPYKRIDILPSSRHVRVVISGETVAESTRPMILLETGMPVRYYLPPTDVRMDLLRPSEVVTRCPYKGEAHYYSVEAIGDTAQDIAWYYRYPVTESAKIAGYVCFFNEKVDLYVDGELQTRPRTRWS